MNPGLDLICFSHLPWDVAFQRPHQLMSSCSGERRVFYFEEPSLDGEHPPLNVREVSPRLYVVTAGQKLRQSASAAQRQALRKVCEQYAIDMPIAWFYTPLALEFARDMLSSLTVYDCTELSLPASETLEHQDLERELLACADLVFTSTRSLFESKRRQNPNVHLLYSSVDMAHFSQARRGRAASAQVHSGKPGTESKGLAAPADQANIPGPRLGFCGAIDERLDLGLLAQLARARPNWQLVLLGPIVKLDDAALPRLPNIHYLGQKSYAQLPEYLRGWDVGIMPFALNESTRFFSPTKTLECLASGVPVVSTPIAVVVTPYAERGWVRVANDCDSFVHAVEQSLRDGGLADKLPEVDAFMATGSWPRTWQNMSSLVTQSLAIIGHELPGADAPVPESKVA